MLKTTAFKKGQVTFSDTGKGRVVVLLHGFLGSHQIWEQTTTQLSKSYRVIAIDLPGHGNTYFFNRKLSITAFTHLAMRSIVCT